MAQTVQTAQSAKKITPDPYYSTLRQSMTQAALPSSNPAITFAQTAWEPPKTATESMSAVPSAKIEKANISTRSLAIRDAKNNQACNSHRLQPVGRQTTPKSERCISAHVSLPISVPEINSSTDETIYDQQRHWLRLVQIAKAANEVHKAQAADTA